MAFINGDILFEKTINNNNDYTLLPRPFLKALYIEMVD
jgi:hypothetical protein